MTDSTDLVPVHERPEVVIDDLAGMTLEQLAERANSEARQADAAARRAVQAMSEGLVHALNAGDALLIARSRVEPGTWRAWLAQNWERSPQLAQKYMRVAAYRPHVEQWARQGGNGASGLVAALRTLEGLPHTAAVGWRAHPDEVKERARQLHAEGATVQQISDLVGASWVTVKGWVDPAYAKQVSKRSWQHTKRREKAAKALAEKESREENDRLARQAGGAISATYAHVRKALADCSRAIEEAEGGEQRDALRNAMAKLHAAEDEIVRALKIERRAA